MFVFVIVADTYRKYQTQHRIFVLGVDVSKRG